MREKKILILANKNILAPRVQLEKTTLEEAGFNIEVSYRTRVFFRIKVIAGLFGYYVKTLKKAASEEIFAVHITHISQIPLAPLLRIFRKKIVYDAYERHSFDISQRHFSGPLKPLIKTFIEVFENTIVKFCIDSVLVVSTPNEYLLKRYKRYCNKLECLYNVPSKKNIFKDSLAKKWSEEKLNLVYTGGINPDKGSHRFVPLAKLLKKEGVSFALHIIGFFPNDRVRKSLENEIHHENLQNSVILHGYMNYVEMTDFLCRCHIGLSLHSKIKRFSHIGKGTVRKNFEYMAAGLLTICTDVGQLGYVINEENAGFVLSDPDDLPFLASLIMRIDSDRSLALVKAKNSLNAVRYRYNWETEDIKVIALYEELFAKS